MDDFLAPSGRAAPNSGPLDGKLFLVGLGAQKAGSTWLARYLGSHPQVYVSRLKELHYFDAMYKPQLCGHVPRRMLRMAVEIAEQMKAGDQRVRKQGDRLKAILDRLQMTLDRRYEYMQFFKDRVTREDVFCDITPAYSILDEDGYRAIMKTHPNVRFIFILRDPVDRFWSAIRMAMRKLEGFEPYQRFYDQLDAEEHVLRTDYKRTILELENVAPVDSIKYVFYEHLFTPETTDEVTSFIGVKPWPANFHNVVNPGERLPLEPEHGAAAFKKFAHVYDFVFKRFGARTPTRWRERAEQYG